MCFNDRTYCASPDCENKCGRKMTIVEEQEAVQSGLPVSYGYFCGELKEEKPMTAKHTPLHVVEQKKNKLKNLTATTASKKKTRGLGS